tara:strand:+ start:502 stop:684 length:183 start_codon:yes stop_codon:yes gene_type:complete
MMKSKQENQKLFEEAQALKEAMRALIHNQVVNEVEEEYKRNDASGANKKGNASEINQICL